jgi:hypothetical protein
MMFSKFRRIHLNQNQYQISDSAKHKQILRNILYSSVTSAKCIVNRFVHNAPEVAVKFLPTCCRVMQPFKYARRTDDIVKASSKECNYNIVPSN